MNIVIGGKYKVDAPNSTGWYEILKVEQDTEGNITSVICKGKEAFSRVFRPEQLVKQQATQQPRVKGKLLEKVGELKGSDIHNFKVESWPNEKKRGRPRKS